MRPRLRRRARSMACSTRALASPASPPAPAPNWPTGAGECAPAVHLAIAAAAAVTRSSAADRRIPRRKGPEASRSDDDGGGGDDDGGGGDDDDDDDDDDDALFSRSLRQRARMAGTSPLDQSSSRTRSSSS